MGEFGIVVAAVGELSIIAACVTAFCLAGGLYLAFRKAPIERDGVYISTAEGATRILNSALMALEKDVERKGALLESLMTDCKALRADLARKDEVIADLTSRNKRLETLAGEDVP